MPNLLFKSRWVGSILCLSSPTLRSTIVCSAILSGSAGAGAQTLMANDCPRPAAVSEVKAQTIYADSAGSVLNNSGLRQNQELIAPLRSFDRTLATMVDGVGANKPTISQLDCASKMLMAWAEAGALLTPPRSFPSIRERQRFTLGINVSALKLKEQAGQLDLKVVDWLRRLNRAIIGDFSRRAVVDNLYVWSGVNAASFALIDNDQIAVRYRDRVWLQAIGQIDQGGYLASELRRQSRALLYHQYYLSGLLLLREMRKASGAEAEAADGTALIRLVDLVERSLCDSAEMSKAVGGLRMETAPDDQFAVGQIFGQGLLDKRWSSCGVAAKNLNIETMGGDLRLTRDILDRMSNHHNHIKK